MATKKPRWVIERDVLKQEVFHDFLTKAVYMNTILINEDQAKNYTLIMPVYVDKVNWMKQENLLKVFCPIKPD